jgi:hypothetical protein
LLKLFPDPEPPASPLTEEPPAAIVVPPPNAVISPILEGTGKALVVPPAPTVTVSVPAGKTADAL